MPKKPRLLFVADGRSPIARNWMAYFTAAGYEVHLASTFAVVPQDGFASVEVVPVAFSQVKSGDGSRRGNGAAGQRVTSVRARTAIRQWLGPLTLNKAAQQLQAVVRRVRPDLIHAMRIPFEGMLAAQAVRSSRQLPLLVSVWGNDFTLHAPATPWMSRSTRLALGCASALHTDCYRDLRLAHAWGFSSDRPAVVLPGSGGVQMDIFSPDPNRQAGGSPVVINPRGLRAYVSSAAFFQSIPLVLRRHPDTCFLCPGMAGEAQAGRWLEELHIAASVQLLPKQSRTQMAGLFRRGQVSVSPSTHDGTPNTLLEGMACGCFPVAGDLESLREWIVPGVNGLLVDPDDPVALAEAIILALEQPDLRARAAKDNLGIITSRAEYGSVMQRAENFYKEIAGGG